MSDTNGRRWVSRLAALDANLLVALDALIQEGNVTAAARRVGITQSAMSQTLRRLRAQFDDPILVRVGRHMTLTPFALRLKSRLHRALAELESVLRERPQFDPATADHRFVVAAADYLAMVLLPKLRIELARRAPRVSLAVHALDAGSIIGSMERGDVDLYVGVPGDAERGLLTERLFDEGFRVLVRAGHPLAKGRLTAESYANADHLHVSPRRSSGSIVGRALAAAGLTRRVAVEVPYFGVVAALLTSSELVATLPQRLAEALAAEHGLVQLPVPIELPGFEICMAWHPSSAGEPALEWLRGIVRQTSGDHATPAVRRPPRGRR